MPQYSREHKGGNMRKAKKITEYLLYGSDNGLTLDDLTLISGKSKRMLRKEIEEAIGNGEHIVNFQDGNGYYYTEDRGELLHYYYQEQKRIDSLKSRLNPLQAELRALGLI